MSVQIQELFERARQCFAKAHTCGDAQEKRELQKIGDRLLKEAHDLANIQDGWPATRKPKSSFFRQPVKS